MVKKIMYILLGFVVMGLLLYIVLSLFHDDEYYCNNCHIYYNDGHHHYVLDQGVDLTLCEGCYKIFCEEGTILGCKTDK